MVHRIGTYWWEATTTGDIILRKQRTAKDAEARGRVYKPHKKEGWQISVGRGFAGVFSKFAKGAYPTRSKAQAALLRIVKRVNK